ncbi:hypothetical protein DRP05_04840 [Archaeoglobales archaeon]|nr:MAG: hypothetical protein DRP05_04840 [Archaeoglobales archaeon]
MLTVLKQLVLKHMSFFYRSGNELKMELAYTKGSWTPTWMLSRETINKIDVSGFVDKKFVVDVLEGSYIKRVIKEKDDIRTMIYLVTRSGLVEIPYEYKNKKYALNTGIVLNDLERRKRVGEIYANFRKRNP